MCELHCVGTHVPSGTLNQHTVTPAQSRVPKEHLSGGHRHHRHRGRLEEVRAPGLVRQHVSESERILRVRAGKTGIGNPEHFIAHGKGAIARPGRLDNAREICAECERQRLWQCAMPGSYQGIPWPDACRMNSDQNLVRTGRWAWHVLEEDDLGTSESVDATGFHCRRHKCVLCQTWIE
jgi:hypothetical protein